MSIEASAKSLRSILEDTKGINVPWYQREYKWQAKQIDEVFSDILVFFGQNEGQSAFLGSIVFCPGDDGCDEVIDGQQRLTTLSIMVSVVAGKLLNSDKENEFALEAFRLLWRKEEKKPKLLHRKDEDRVLFEEIVAAIPRGVLRVLTDPNPTRIADVINARDFVKDKSIYNAYEIVGAMVSEAIQSACESRKLDLKSAYLQLLKVLLDQVTLVRIHASAQTDGIRIFEALNALGMKLEMDELIRSSYYMNASKFSAVVKDKVKRAWEDYDDSINEVIDTNSERVRFLRSYWLSRYGMVVKSRLFDAYSERLRVVVNTEGESGLLRESSELKDAANIYAAMRGEKGYFSCLTVLHSFSAVMHRVPLMALASSRSLTGVKLGEAIKRVGFVLESVFVRMSICGQTTNSIDKSFSELAILLGKDAFGTDPLQIENGVRLFFTDASHQIPPDDVFITSLLHTSIEPGSRKWKAFFIRLGAGMRRGPDLLYRDDIDPSEVDLDYLSPVFAEPSRTEYFRMGYSDAIQYSQGVKMIGNIKLVHPSSGRAIDSPVNRSVAQGSIITAAEIRSRVIELSSHAAKIWKV
jgi:hypothetical protein